MRIPDELEALMRLALSDARVAPDTGDIPIGAVVVGPDGRILGRGQNRREANHDPTAHAEIVAIREACQALETSRLDGCTLVTTLEPCAMCAGATLTARIARVVFGAWDEKAGAAGSRYDLLRDRRLPLSTEVIGGVLEEECAALLTKFFREEGLVPGPNNDRLG